MIDEKQLERARSSSFVAGVVFLAVSIACFVAMIYALILAAQDIWSEAAVMAAFGIALGRVAWGCRRIALTGSSGPSDYKILRR